MLDFLRDLFSRPGAARTVILLEPDTMSAPRQYEVRPGYAVYGAVIGVVLLAAVLIALVVLTPLRALFGGASAGELRSMAEDNATRAAAFEDSLTIQAEQIDLLRELITGGVDTGDADTVAAPGAGPAPLISAREPPAPSPAPRVEAAPSRPISAMSPAAGPGPLALRSLGAGDRATAEAYLGALRLPSLPPLDGVVSRGFDPTRAHFGLDIAADVGTPVRAIGAGYVVLADWTHGGGYTVAVHHPDGYLSVYKHNSRLLKRVGERVRTREVIALSGDTGAATSGPHLHVELWRDGLAQDPAAFFLMR